MESQTVGKLTEALAKAQIAFLPVKRTEKVDFSTAGGARKKYNYAPLEAVIEATKKALSDNGLAVMQTLKSAEESTLLEPLLSHISGEWVKSEVYVGKQDLAPQLLGSALTYMRRYSLSAILNIASEEDDDAESVTGREQIPQDAELITEPQRKKLFASAEEKDIIEEVKAYIATTFGKAHSSSLLKAEASLLIEAIETGKILKRWEKAVGKEQN